MNFADFRHTLLKLVATLPLIFSFLTPNLANAKLKDAEKDFLKKYEVYKDFKKLAKKKKERAAERMLPFLIKLHDLMQEQTDAGTVTHLPRSKKIRANLFHLEAAMKLYEKSI